MKNFLQLVCFLTLTFSIGASILFYPKALINANAADSSGIQTGRHDFNNFLERISPVTLAYHRLKAVLTAHGNPETIPFVLPAVKSALSSPLALPMLTRRLTNPTNSLMSGNRSEIEKIQPEAVIREFISKAATLFSLAPDPETHVKISPSGSNGSMSMEMLMDRMAATINSADSFVRLAFSDIASEERVRLLKIFPKALDEFFKVGNLSGWDAYLITAAARKIHMAQLLRGFSVLANLFSKDFLNSIRLAVSSAPPIPLDRKKYPGLKGRFLLIRETPLGLMLIGDKGPNVYGANAALIIDPGGDDLYLNNAGASVHEIQERAVSGISGTIGVVIDFEGDDRYINPGFNTIASGFFGLGVILDMAGNDVYNGGQLSLGASFFGMGCLMDLSGNDTYVSSEGGQGCAFFGAAFLFDGEGNDLYSGAKYVQGVGGPMGFGELSDVTGKDHYRAGWKYGSSYGTKGIYQGCSQGVGWGFRKYAAGGIGILSDSDGDDTYEAGNFSQGTGYCLGLGILRDDAGHDIYRGSRYCQGAAAHQAAGALLDFGGNDAYSGKIAANQGAAWDLSVACLVDYAGDDGYKAGDLSLGAGAQNAVGLFLDGEGNDRYESPAGSLGFSGDLSYGGGRNAGNMGISLDMGGGTDFFSLKDRQNDTFLVKGNMGIFLDE
ncbi:MAG: hypothetical protein K9N10_16285 [Deltaproteobacteria bacterium]|nr:hypothetical protein [Deltaproteobacteria bacterium]